MEFARRELSLRSGDRPRPIGPIRRKTKHLPPLNALRQNFSVSHIAWSPSEDDEALALLAELGIHSLEVAPGRIWPQAGDTPQVQARQKIKTLRNFGVAGFQAILFGKPELQLFDDASRPKLLAYLSRLALLCASAGGRYLVFGAPGNRWVPESRDPREAAGIAEDFFRQLGTAAARIGVSFGIEANPASYGCNFCTHVEEVARLVKNVGSPGIHWHLDTGEIAMNQESLPSIIEENFSLLRSVHVSEPHMGDFFEPWPGHHEVASLLRRLHYRGPISLEMKRPAGGLPSVRRAIEFLAATYN